MAWAFAFVSSTLLEANLVKNGVMHISVHDNDLFACIILAIYNLVLCFTYFSEG